jgi:hypothetical protein
VTLDPPVLVIVSDRDWVLPTVTVPKLRLAGLAPNVPAVVPVPVKGIARVGLGAFEVIVRLPLATPLAVGVNVTLKLVLCPALSVTGAVIPLNVNPLPVIPAWEIVTLDPPLFVTVSERARLLPTVTLPKLRLLGFAPSAPAVTPVPDNGIANEGLAPSEVIVTAPFALPLDCGAKVTVKVVL